MLKQCLELLRIEPGKTYIDATAGAGGHLRGIAEKAGNDSRIIGIDQDTYALHNLEQALSSEGYADRVKLIHSNFRDIKSALSRIDVATVDGGILADLGVSSMQLDNSARGFSFAADGPLDMRMDPTALVTAEQLVNTLPENELADIIFHYGEERLSRRIAHRIVQSRPLHTTAELAAVVSPVVRGQRHRGDRDKSHPATRTFQALRIAVNDELKAIEEFLRTSVEILAPGARLVVITFHSLEDRIVKQFLKEAASTCVCPPRQPICNCGKIQTMKVLTTKPLQPEEEEVLANPRSRSAKLRAGQKVI